MPRRFAAACLTFLVCSGAQAEILAETRAAWEGLEAQTMDGAHSLALGGRLMFDYANFTPDARLGDGKEVRRALVEAEGTIHYDWDFEVGIDLSEDEWPEVKDLWLSYRLGDDTTLRFGQFKEPVSLEEQTSSRYLTFLERALPVDALAPGRNMGLALLAGDDHWSLAVGGFGADINDTSWREGWNGSGVRATWAPWAEERRTLHLGASFNHRGPNPERKVRLRARPEAHLANERLVSTGKLKDYDGMQVAGLESALVYGSFSAQAEFLQARVERLDHADPRFHGWYAYASWFLTGESRHYDGDDGDFGRVRPLLPYGAWEVALRRSHLDLMDAGVDGGRESNTTLALNWYPHAHVRLMANYVWIDTHPDEDGDDTEAEAFLMRLQLDI